MRLKKTVLQVIPALDAGGAERTTVEIAAALIAAGGRALVATSGGRLCAEIEKIGGKVFPMPVDSKNPAVIWRNRRRLAALIEDEKVDLVHARSRAPAWSALWAARRMRTPFVTTYHGAYSARTALKRLYNSAMVRGDLVIANSGFTAAGIRAEYDIPPPKLIVIPRGADLAVFNLETVSKARTAALTSVWSGDKPPAFRFLLPGRLTSWKGQMTAIEAVWLIANSSSASGHSRDLKLILAGDAQGRDNYAQALQQEIETRGVRDMIQIVGHCADMPAAYAWADAVLAPSARPEAFGRVAVEAGAMGRPVIAAAHGGSLETIIDGETGALFPPGDAAALAEAMQQIAAMPEEARRAMGARARRRVEKSFSTQAMCEATLRAYAELGG